VRAIKEIGETIGQMSEIASTVAAAVEEQGVATWISRNVQQAAQVTQQVSSNSSMCRAEPAKSDRPHLRFCPRHSRFPAKEGMPNGSS
jgi:hypothetical protein